MSKCVRTIVLLHAVFTQFRPIRESGLAGEANTGCDPWHTFKDLFAASPPMVLQK
jgi:hypothetical protein